MRLRKFGQAVPRLMSRPVGSLRGAMVAATLASMMTPAFSATLTLYAAQHEQTVDLISKAFTKETGIEVKVHNGEPPELASQLIKEGASSPADVFFTANSPELELLAEKGLLAKVDPKTLAAVPANDNGQAVGSASWRAKMFLPTTSR